MNGVKRSDERSPLLRRSTSSSTSPSSSERPVTDDDRAHDTSFPTISKPRGALIIGSIGLLIFLTALVLEIRNADIAPQSFYSEAGGPFVDSLAYDTMPATNISMLTTTQSAIAADLDAFEEAIWFTSSYLIAMSSLAPLMGRLSQVFSPRLCMFSSSVLICTGCVVSSLANTFKAFIAGRALAGAGGAGILIVATIIVLQMTSPERRGLFIGLANSGMTVGISLGAIIAGALAPKIGWKPLFGVQAPMSILAGFGLLAGIPVDYVAKNNGYKHFTLRQKLVGIDYSGSLLLIATITLFLLGLSGPRILATPLILSAFALPLFVLNEIYVAKDPVIPISVLRSRGTLLTCFATLGFMMARWGVLFYTPVYALAVRGWKPAVAGSILIPTNAGFATGGLLAGVFHIRRSGSFYTHTLIAMMLAPPTLLVIAFISTADSPWGLYVLIVFCNGALAGAALNYALVHLLHLTAPEIHPIVISLLATFRGFAGSFGSAIGGGFFERVLHKSLVDGFAGAGLEDRGDLIRRLLGSPALVYDKTLTGQETSIAVHAYEDGLRALFLGAMGLSVVVALVQAGTGSRGPAKKDEQIAAEEEVDEGETLIARP